MEISRPSLEERAAECAWELTFSATVAYDGAPFAGFAKQPGQLTVHKKSFQCRSRQKLHDFSRSFPNRNIADFDLHIDFAGI